MATGYLLPISTILQFFTDQGVVLAGGKIYTYVAGTTTPVATYTSSSLSVLQANPIILQSNGRMASPVWVPGGVIVKMVLQDSSGNVISGGTIDNLSGINDPSGLTGSTIGSLLYPITAQETAASVTPTNYTYPSLNILRYGADPTGNTDSSNAINSAIAVAELTSGYSTLYTGQNTYGAIVTIPPGTYKTTVPIVLYQGVSLVGSGSGNTIIKKTTNTVGSGSSAAPARSGINDSYAVDSIISIWHLAGYHCYYANIKGIFLQGTSNTYGIYAPRVSQNEYDDVQINNVVTGWYTNDGWMLSLNRMTFIGVQNGFVHADDGSGSGTGTSNAYNACYVNGVNSTQQPNVGYNFFGLSYSTMNSCAADNLTRTDTGVPSAYYFSSCHSISLNGCGCESSTAQVVYAVNSNISVIDMYTLSISGNASWSSIGYLTSTTNSVVTYINCNFAAFTSAGAAYNMVIQLGATQTEIDSVMPTGGNSFISYSSSSTRKVLSGGAVTLYGTAAGTPLLNLNTTATTGSQTATFTATNKPGSGTTAPTKWLPVSLDGTTYYIPAWT